MSPTTTVWHARIDVRVRMINLNLMQKSEEVQVLYPLLTLSPSLLNAWQGIGIHTFGRIVGLAIGLL